MVVVITLLAVVSQLPVARERFPLCNLMLDLELRSIDWRFHQRGPRSPGQDVVVIGVDTASVRAHGWPWPRELYAALLQRLFAARVRLVVFDIAFPEPQTPAGDAALAAATRRWGSRIVHCALGPEGAVTVAPDAAQERLLEAKAWPVRVADEGAGQGGPLPLGDLSGPLAAIGAPAAAIGFADLRDTGDGVYRSVELLGQYRERYYPSLALAAVAVDLGLKPEEIVFVPGRELRLGDQRAIPLVIGSAMWVDFAGREATFPRISATELLGPQPPRLESLAGNIAVVGYTASGVVDRRPSPYGSDFSGVEIHASAIDTILNRHFLRSTALGADLLVTLLVGLMAGLILPVWRPVWAGLWTVALVALYAAICAEAFRNWRLLLPMAAPNVALLGSLVTILTYRLATEERQRGRLKQTFGLFVPPAIVDRLTADDASVEQFAGERREVTVLFADLRDFTAFAESRPPEEVVLLLNRYFSLMHDVVWEHGGTLDKYMGDCLMAFFGAPLPQPDHARRAVRAALEMQRRAREYELEWRSLGMADLRAGIGIHTGEGVVGFVGSKGRPQYTVIGDDVNLASRLQELSRELGTEILTSRQTYELVRDDVEASSLGLVAIRGMSAPVEVFSITGLRSGRPPSPATPEGGTSPLGPESSP